MKPDDLLNPHRRSFLKATGATGAAVIAGASGLVEIAAGGKAAQAHAYEPYLTDDQLETFGEPDYVIYNAGDFPANRHTAGMTSTTSIDLSLPPRVHHPRLGVRGRDEEGRVHDHELPDAEAGRAVDALLGDAGARRQRHVGAVWPLGYGQDHAVGHPKRLLIGDDEHCWTDTGVFNIEGGCYAKVIKLSKEQEPDIWNSLSFGAVLENVVYEPPSRVVDYDNVSITENTRGSYILDSIPNAKLPAVGGHPKNIRNQALCAMANIQVFLTFDPGGLTCNAGFHWFRWRSTLKSLNAGFLIRAYEMDTLLGQCLSLFIEVAHRFDLLIKFRRIPIRFVEPGFNSIRF